MNFTANTLTTNSTFLYVDGTVMDPGATYPNRSLLLNGNTYQLSYPKSAIYHPLVDAAYTDGSDWVPANVTLGNNSYADATVASDLAAARFVNARIGYAVDTFAYNIVITGASGVPFTRGPGLPATRGPGLPGVR
jgi:hypothetical protein